MYSVRFNDPMQDILRMDRAFSVRLDNRLIFQAFLNANTGQSGTLGISGCHVSRRRDRFRKREASFVKRAARDRAGYSARE